MAGYKRADDKDFVNATTFNKQMERQRAAYKSRDPGSLLGIYKSNSIFPENRENILESSFNVFKSLDEKYEVTVEDPGNVDFNQNIRLDYKDATDMFGDINSPIDIPNIKGPNLLIPPDINTHAVPTPRTVDSSFKNKGYGWKDVRNEPASEASTLGSYFKTHYSLGTSIDPPRFGEANDLGDDVIDYKQPNE
jgi:hypothetical protein